MITSLGAQILRDGLDDWVPLAAVSGAARRLGAASEGEARRQISGEIRQLATQGLVHVGEVTAEGFSPWPGSLEEILARLEATPGDETKFTVWLRTTDLGDELARAQVDAGA